MPNHVHGILVLGGESNGVVNNDCTVETRHALSLQPPLLIQPSEKTISQQRFQNQGKNTLSSIVGSYKSAVTKHAHRLGYNFAWQTRYHDHIIRNDASYQRIAEYIVENVVRWGEDRFFDGGDGVVV